jgi:hypothetical protein
MASCLSAPGWFRRRQTAHFDPSPSQEGKMSPNREPSAGKEPGPGSDRPVDPRDPRTHHSPGIPHPDDANVPQPKGPQEPGQPATPTTPDNPVNPGDPTAPQGPLAPDSSPDDTVKPLND